MEINAAVTEPLPVNISRNPNGSALVLHAVTGIEIFCSMPPDVENSGIPITNSGGAIKGNKADVPELIRRAREGNHCSMDDFPPYLEQGHYSPIY